MRCKGTLIIDRSLLNLKMMLEGGQSFRWKSESDKSWIGVMGGLVWHLSQSEKSLTYEAFRDGPILCSDLEVEKKLTNYLRLDAPLADYYGHWSKCDKHFAEIAGHCYGIRMLQQDPVENVFSFICSSNNNIARITTMVDRMCTHFGDPLGDGYYAFPTVERLSADDVEEKLRHAGLGYRAKYIAQSARQLQSLGGISWLQNLSKGSYENARKALQELSGVGSKVADCICLMSLGFLEALPVDTHVYQIAVRWYMPELVKKSQGMSLAVHNAIGNHFREMYGPLAGWAHTVLFCGELKKFNSKESKSKKSVKCETVRKQRKRKVDSSNSDGV